MIIATKSKENGMETSVITMILKNGTPTKIVQCNLDEWIGVSYKIPRNRLNEAKELRNIDNIGVYIYYLELMKKKAKIEHI